MLKLFALNFFVDTFNLLLVFAHKVSLKTMNSYPHDENYSQSQKVDSKIRKRCGLSFSWLFNSNS
jgi:hypothetical protein